ncbi:MAG TPA: hypothetical protein VJ917_01640 [Saprospiraceae bacterium]|nr:hypothetical protein [Saprospiraceae bacterium]
MKINWIFYLLILGLLFVACDDDDDDDDVMENEITINILEPTEGETIALADCAEVHLHIEFTATVEMHEIEIELHPEDDVDDVIFEYDEHNHDLQIDFEQDVNLCDYAGQCFHLEVASYKDHDGNEKERADVEFCLE